MASTNSRFLSQSDSASGSRNSGKVTPHQDTASKSATCEEREKLAKSCEAYAEEYRKEERERFKMYEAEFTQELMAKYFSNQDIFGDKHSIQDTIIRFHKVILGTCFCNVAWMMLRTSDRVPLHCLETLQEFVPFICTLDCLNFLMLLLSN